MLSTARRHILAALAMLILAGCGSRGPLYLPQPKAQPSGEAASPAPPAAPSSGAKPAAEAERKKE